MSGGASVTGKVLTSDGLAYSGEVYLYHLLVTSIGTGGAWEVNDSLDDSGTDLWGGDVGPNVPYDKTFSPPIKFATGLYVDIAAGCGIKVSVGYGGLD